MYYFKVLYHLSKWANGIKIKFKIPAVCTYYEILFIFFLVD